MARARKPLRLFGALAAATMVAASCGSSDGETSAGQTDSDLPTVVVTTNILGDVVENLVGNAANVVTIMPVGADPHDFSPSAQQVAQLTDADAVIVNGAGFEEGLLDVIESAEDDGVQVFEAMSVIDAIEFGEGGHDHDDHSDEEHSDEEHSDEEHSDEEHSDEEHSDEEHSDEEHSDEEHSDEDHDEHDHSGDDPHFFTDPARMAIAAEGITEFLIANVEGIDADTVQASSDTYLAELATLDEGVADILSAVPETSRVLVTNHEVFGYFADRYGFEIVGTVIPGGSTSDGANAEALAELAEIVEAEGIPAVFADTSSSDELAQTLALEAGEVTVVALYSESLGDADSDGATYLDMLRTNAQRIADALGG